METQSPPEVAARAAWLVRAGAPRPARAGRGPRLRDLLFGMNAAGIAAAGLAALYTFYYSLRRAGLELPQFWEGMMPAGALAEALFAAALALGVGAALLAAAGDGTLARRLAPLDRVIGQGGPAVRVGLRVAGAALSAAYAAAHFLLSDEYASASLARLTDGTAWAPYQYRALVPLLVGAVRAVIPGADLHALYAVAEGAAAFGVYLAFAALVASFGGGRRRAQALALVVFVPLLATFAAPFRALPIYYPADTPAVLFFTLGLLALRRRPALAYYAIFILGTLNRETTCFLTAIYVLTALGRERPRAIAGHVALQAVLWVGVKVLLAAHFGALPIEQLYATDAPVTGGPGLFVTMLPRNLAFLANPLSYLYLATAMAGLWVPVAALWRHVPSRWVRRALLVAPPFLVGMTVVGLLAEVRIYGELIPLVTLAYLLLLGALASRAEAEAGRARRAPTQVCPGGTEG